MRIAYFTDTFYPEVNGVAQTLKNLSDYLCQNGVEHQFFAPEYETDVPDVIQSPTVRFKGIASSLYAECRLSFPMYTLHKDKIRAFNPDLIHITTPLGIGHLGLRYAREHQLPVVMSYHTNFDQYLKFYNIEYLEHTLWGYMKWFYNKSDLTLCPSLHTLEALHKKGFKRLGIWSRGINTQKFSPRFRNNILREALGGKDKTLFLYVGRIAVEKDLDTLLESIRIVNQSYGDRAGFVFTGDGPYADILKSAAYPNVTFTGLKKGRELAEIYASCDAFVFPSGTETFGNVLLEAMASGLPSVCVNSGGILDFARQGINALVCEYRDPQSIADGIILLLKEPRLAKKLSNGALLTAGERSWETIFGGLIQSYKKIVLRRQNIAV